MRKNEIKVGGLYEAKVSDVLTVVRVDSIKSARHGIAPGTNYSVTNLRTKRTTVFRSAAKFRRAIQAQPCPKCKAWIPQEDKPRLLCVRCEAENKAQSRKPKTEPEPMTVEEARETLSGCPPTDVEEQAWRVLEEAGEVRPSRDDLEENVHPERVADRLRLEERALRTPTEFNVEGQVVNGQHRVGQASLTPMSLKPDTRKAIRPSSPLASTLRDKVAPKLEIKGHPHIIVEALAGSGKTFCLVVGVINTFRDRVSGLWNRLKKELGFEPEMAPQQQAVWDFMKSSASANTVQFTAFNNSIVGDFESKWSWVIQELGRAGIQFQFATNHSMGNSAVRRAFPGLGAVNKWRVSDIIGEILGADPRDLRREKVVVVNATEKLVEMVKANLTDTNPETLEQLASYYDIDLCDDGPKGASHRDEVFGLVPKVIERCKDVRRDMRIDFNDMIWLPVVLDLPVFKHDLLLVDEYQDANRARQELIYRAGKRLILCGDRNQCQPKGTMIHKCWPGDRWNAGSTKAVPIESIKAGDFIASWDRRYGNFVARAKVNAISSRNYQGDVLTVRVGDKSSRCTPNHKWITRWTTHATDLWCVYLMKRTRLGSSGSVCDYRIGWCQLFNKAGDSHLAHRSRLEGADAAWILSTHTDKSSASLQESYLAIRFQIPLVMFNEVTNNAPYTNEWLLRYWNKIHACMDLEQNATNLLSFAGRDIAYPLYSKSQRQRQGQTTTFETQACNLIPELMALPTAPATIDSEMVASWRPIDLIDRESFNGLVYSMDVDKHHKYISDRLVTCNSIYGFSGADTQGMDRSFDRLSATPAGCIKLPLTVTRRCGKAIVREAQEIVPSFEAHTANGEGKVSEAKYPIRPKSSNYWVGGGESRELPYEETYMPLVQDGDMVLCRCNAPLVSQCFRFLKRGRKAWIQGRDIAAGLLSTIKKLNADSVPDLITRLMAWADSETQKENAKKNPSDTKLILIQDRIECILCFTEGSVTLEDVEAKIKKVFGAKDCPRCKDSFDEGKNCPKCKTPGIPRAGIKFSSVHKAKGQEAKRVFLLQVEGASMPHPMAKKAWEQEQEMNIKYVAVTRAIDELVWVS